MARVRQAASRSAAVAANRVQAIDLKKNSKQGLTPGEALSRMRALPERSPRRSESRFERKPEGLESVAVKSCCKFQAASPSSSGLGHRPFTAVTGVRVP
ncbi:hypothetical protein OF001_U60135 [Pseudomonas sp. OF001]|nr:hypothetical protein OF001_U60135 [Pseudomonas sp. OF001]